MSTMFQGSNCTNFSDILEHLESLHPAKCALIPNLLTIVHLILINPATSCTPERSFSVARRIKTWLRLTMTTKRFNNLSTLPIHKELTGSTNLVDIGNKFALEFDARKLNLRKFVPGDLIWLFYILLIHMYIAKVNYWCCIIETVFTNMGGPVIWNLLTRTFTFCYLG